jgi:cell division protease FtsH
VTALQALQRLGIAGGNPEPRKREPGIGFAGTPRGADDAAGGILGQRIEFNLTRLLDKAEQILKDSRLVVLAVAHALETYKTLTGDDVVSVIEGRRGPFVDGRPYHLPGFLPMMETYHEAAVQAHQRHAKPEVTLPDVEELQYAPTWASNGDGEAHPALPAGDPAPAPEPGQNGQGRPALESTEES